MNHFLFLLFAFTLTTAHSLAALPSSFVEPHRHYPIPEHKWDPEAAKKCIKEIIQDTIAAHRASDGWPTHPLDESSDPQVGTNLYEGEAGIYWALEHLSHSYDVSFDLSQETLANLQERSAKEYAESYHAEGGSLFFSDLGVLLLRFKMAPSGELADEIFRICTRKEIYPNREMMWGNAGVMLVVNRMHSLTKQERWKKLYRSLADKLLADVIDLPEVGKIWPVAIYSLDVYYGLGPFHGFLGNIHALNVGRDLLSESQRKEINEIAINTMLATARSNEQFANWVDDIEIDNEEQTPTQLQFCHGAPGTVAILAELPNSSKLDEVLLKAGELIWSAGALKKGAGICHGTAGNGYAFLKLHKRTGDEKWLDRARQFAMEAIASYIVSKELFKQGRYNLWMGDLGVALYLQSCLEEDAKIPNFDRM